MLYSTYAKVVLSGAQEKFGTGWLPPLPDLRDYTDSHPDVAPLTQRLGLGPNVKAVPAVPATADLRPWCSDVENQGQLGSCTAQAAVGVVEYFERRAFGSHIDASRLFVYKCTRNLLGVTGDTGAWLRNTIGALVLCGLSPEDYWPYTDQAPDFDKEPSSFVYAVADNFEAVKYFCHDPQGKSVAPQSILATVKQYLAAGFDYVVAAEGA